MKATIASMDASTARTENMRRLVAEAGGPADWARRYGGTRWAPAQVSQWISESKPKGIGGRLARDLEVAMGMRRGELDRPPGSGLASQPARLDPEIVRAAHAVLRGTYADDGKVYDIEEEPDLFAMVYQRLANITGKPARAELISIGRAIGERQQGGVDGGTGKAHKGAGKKRAAR